MSRRVVVWIVAVIVAVNVLILVVNEIAPGPSGEASSSLATTPEGFAAWAELARRNGIEVVPLRDRLRDATLPAGATVVALDVPDMPEADARALRAADRVVAGGEDPEAWLEAFDTDLEWEDSAPRVARAVAEVPETADVREVRTRGEGRWDGAPEAAASGGAAPFTALAAGDASLLVVDGDVAFLADSSPLSNEALAAADNAALALALSGDGPLVFAESLHGYGDATGLAALPGEAKGALVLLLAAALLLMLARGRRFGPPEAASRELQPPRAAYVDALGGTLARTNDPEGAMAPVRRALGEDDVERLDDHEDAVELARRLQATRGGPR